MNKITIKTFSGTPSPHIFTGNDLVEERAPVGFYRNVDKSYTGIILVSRYGHCTYFDINVNLVYAFSKDIWGKSKFVLIPDMKKIEVSLD